MVATKHLHHGRHQAWHPATHRDSVRWASGSPFDGWETEVHTVTLPAGDRAQPRSANLQAHLCSVLSPTRLPRHGHNKSEIRGCLTRGCFCWTICPTWDCSYGDGPFHPTVNGSEMQMFVHLSSKSCQINSNCLGGKLESPGKPWLFWTR